MELYKPDVWDRGSRNNDYLDLSIIYGSVDDLFKLGGKMAIKNTPIFDFGGTNFLWNIPIL